MESDQSDFVYIITEMSPSVEGRCEFMEGGAIEKLHLVEKHLLGPHTPSPTNQSTAMESDGFVYRIGGVM